MAWFGTSGSGSSGTVASDQQQDNHPAFHGGGHV
jgi:hypothetical protein